MFVRREDFGTGADALDGRYELQKELGRGATGVVWEAVDRVSSEIVAVKILHRHLLSSVRARKRFVREARSAGVLKHPHSVAVKGHGCGPDGDAYLVMERLLGVTLATVLKGNSEFLQLRAIRIVAQVLEAVSAAHRVNILHRDLKPNNVMLIEHDGDPDFVKVCDFGLAKEFDGAQASSLLTDHGEVCGTPAYMAPEQARGEPLDARADIYAVAVMLFQAVTGRLPFQASSPFALASMHLSAPPPRPSDLRRDISFFPPLESLILRALSKNKAERPSSAEVFRADLLQIERDYRSGEWDRAGGPEIDTLAPAEGVRSGSARTKRLGLAAAFVVVVAATSVFAARRRPRPAAAVAPAVTEVALVPAADVHSTTPPATNDWRSAAPAVEPARAARTRSSAGQRSTARSRRNTPSVPQANAAETEPPLHTAEQRLAAGHVAEACTLGLVAAARTPEDAAVWEFLGRCHMRLPEPRQARAYYRRYLALAPASAKASFIRAIVEREGP
jgi:hypothetical protein